MFTGLIESIGRVVAINHAQRDSRLSLQAGELAVAQIALGASIAVNGVCLTVTEREGDHFWVDVSAESLACTTLGAIVVGAAVNLEQAVLPTTRLGGHLVSGHVDGVGTVAAINNDGRSVRMAITVPDALAKYIAVKGSVCIDGVSLTVNGVSATAFEVNIIPHTMSNTILQHYQVNSRVNIEVDVVARYLERLLTVDPTLIKRTETLTTAFLTEHGFIK